MSSTRSSNTEGAEQAHHVRVPPEAAGGRLDRWLADHPAVPSREVARQLIRNGRVQLNGQGATPARRLRTDDRVTLVVPPPAPMALEPERAELAVLYEDEHLVVVDKPAGVAVHPGPGHGRGTLVHFLLAHCTHLSGIAGTIRPGIVHRLDKDTSGVMVVAKNDRAHQHLAHQFRRHSLERTYLALVVGEPRPAKGTIELPLGRDPHHRVRRGVRPDGKHAVTHWWVVHRLAPFTLVRLKLETGRTHQIRAHLAHMDWPVLGDPLYGRRRHRGLSLPEPVREVLDGLHRQALHAEALGFTHPVTGEWLHFDTPLPPDLARVLSTVAKATALSA